MVAAVGVGTGPIAVAVAPDGKHAYVASEFSNTVSVIETTGNTVVATVPVGNGPGGVAITPDGKHAYVANGSSSNVSVIATATNTVVATIGVGPGPNAVAITPDGKHAYVVGGGVSVIDTATKTVVATIPVGSGGIAITPDGKHAYVANGNPSTVSVIDTATNTVESATIRVEAEPTGVGIVPPPPGVPFLAFGANLVIAFGGAPNQDSFALQTGFALSSTPPGINPLTQAVTLQAGTFAVTIPPGSFKKTPQGYFIFVGMINGARLEVLIEHTGTRRYALQAKATGASFTGTTNRCM